MAKRLVLNQFRLVWTSLDQFFAVQSGFLRFWDIYRLVLVLVLPKIDKRPDWTRLSSTSM